MTEVTEILEVAEKLDTPQQHALLEQLATIIRKKESIKSSVSLSSLSGTGRELWHGVNIDHYLDGERQG